MHVEDNVVLTMTGCNVHNNQATSEGGAMYVAYNAVLTMTGCNVHDNQATVRFCPLRTHITAPSRPLATVAFPLEGVSPKEGRAARAFADLWLCLLCRFAHATRAALPPCTGSE